MGVYLSLPYLPPPPLLTHTWRPTTLRVLALQRGVHEKMSVGLFKQSGAIVTALFKMPQVVTDTEDEASCGCQGDKIDVWVSQWDSGSITG